MINQSWCLIITHTCPQISMIPLWVSLGVTEISNDTEQKNDLKSFLEFLLTLELQDTYMFMPSFPVP